MVRKKPSRADQREAGLSSFTVNTVPREWPYLTEEQVKDTYHGMLELTAKAHNPVLGTKLAAEEEKARSSHHALVVDATVQGEGSSATMGY